MSIRATFGEQSTNRTLTTWYRASQTNPDARPYEIQLHDDGILTCNCRGWTNKKDYQPRSCRHVRELLADAQRYLDSRVSIGRTADRHAEAVERSRAEERRAEYNAKVAAKKQSWEKADLPKKKPARKIQLGGDWE